MQIMNERSLYCHKGFTLIELLVVIGIIGLLTAIMMPAMGLARDQAKNVLDYANLRQISYGNCLTEQPALFQEAFSRAKLWH